MTLSIASLFVAGLALLWNILNATRIDRAQLRADLSFGVKLVGGDPGTDYDVAVVSVTNVGKRAVQLTSLWLAFGRPWRWWARVLPRSRRKKIFSFGLLMPGDDLYLKSISSTIPVKLDVGDVATIYYESSVVVEAAAKADYQWAFARASGTTANASSSRVEVPVAAPDSP